MARNELSKSAMKIADLIRQKASETKDAQAAEYVGVDASTICRFKAEHLDKFCAYLDFLELEVSEKGLNRLTDGELDALKLFAEKVVHAIGK
ncbi:CII family transcriptional regulator [Glaesserella parasuis]|uniref:CII family transcriptional regulator n=1 Tax=Glaesserella parasuis TaxID=738 RepID=UPI00094F71C6|nr:CII family transcriptional regulator [Glaesserella parasuis]MDG6770445.1 CII family transcriptional regulator [Glaesserella parasuis]MDO9872585.1 CII family transcriptional regulator [Glaesserella parasuis]MDP0349789.1 CII family transcriptional regulator [Glaesserella parasuis]MWQ32809.1 hypothetical protein [Glaesserella parasuis]